MIYSNRFFLQGKSITSSGYKYLEMFVKSESGRRLTKILPKLLHTKDMEAFLKVSFKFDKVPLFINLHILVLRILLF